MSGRTAVETLAELDTLDDAEIQEGYRDGRSGEPEPGDNRSKSYWHGWRNGMMDSHRMKPDAASMKLAAEYVRRPTTPEGR